jgi:curved DNA-binding protein CbpA
VNVDPFAALGLPPDPDLTDEQVRAAWRRIATATHPDRPGGDAAAYAAASAAYAQLRTAWGRSEALADLATTPAPGRPPWRAVGVEAFASVSGALMLLGPRVLRGRPGRLAVRVLIAAAIGAAAVAAAHGHPAGPAVAAGAVLWLLLTARSDLAPPPGR